MNGKNSMQASYLNRIWDFQPHKASIRIANPSTPGTKQHVASSKE